MKGYTFVKTCRRSRAVIKTYAGSSLPRWPACSYRGLRSGALGHRIHPLQTPKRGTHNATTPSQSAHFFSALATIKRFQEDTAGTPPKTAPGDGGWGITWAVMPAMMAIVSARRGALRANMWTLTPSCN
eukprot:6207603-Pleurochrysis_carterae.AAC.2